MNRVSTIRIASDSSAVQQMDEQVKAPDHKVEQLATNLAYQYVSLDLREYKGFVNLQPNAIEMRAQT